MLGDSLVISTSSPPPSSSLKLPTERKSKPLTDPNKSVETNNNDPPPQSLDPPTIPLVDPPGSQETHSKVDPHSSIDNSLSPSKVSIQKTRIYVPGIHKTKSKKNSSGGKCVDLVQNAPNEYTTIG